jgi:hypothetical protein
MTHPEDAAEDAGARHIRAASEAQAYRAYLIRCWRDGMAWRFSLESVGASGARRGFSRLEDLIAHVQADLTLPDAGGPGRTGLGHG